MTTIIFRIAWLATLIFGPLTLIGQVADGYEVATWKGFTEAAVSYTWDDGTPNQLPIAKPLFDRYGFKTTFFLATNWIGNWPGFQAAAGEGHEVASHSLSHPNFGNLSTEQRLAELQEAKEAILQNIPDHPVYTFAYPFCAVGTDTQTSEHYISARTCQEQIERTTPTNFMRVSSLPCGTKSNIRTAADFNDRVNSAVAANGWAVFLLHGINGDGGYSPVTSTALDAHLSYVDEFRESIWVGTYGDVVRYIKERDAAVVTETASTDTSFMFQLTHDLPVDIYNVPLSVQRVLPAEWPVATVIQDDRELDVTMRTEGDQKYIRFNAVPNAGTIKIIRIISTSAFNLQVGLEKWEVYPQPSC